MRTTHFLCLIAMTALAPQPSESGLFGGCKSNDCDRCAPDVCRRCDGVEATCVAPCEPSCACPASCIPTSVSTPVAVPASVPAEMKLREAPAAPAAAPDVPQVPVAPTVEPPAQTDRTAPPVPRTYYPTALPESAFVLPKWTAADAEIAFDADERSTF